MYVETIVHEEECMTEEIKFNNKLRMAPYKVTETIYDQFSILITDRNGKQIEKYKIWGKTIRKSKREPAYFLVEEAMNVASKYKGLSVYCDREEFVSAFNHVFSFSGRLKKWGNSSAAEEAYSLWHSRQRLRRNHVSLRFYYDIEKIRKKFDSIVW